MAFHIEQVGTIAEILADLAGTSTNVTYPPEIDLRASSINGFQELMDTTQYNVPDTFLTGRLKLTIHGSLNEHSLRLSYKIDVVKTVANDQISTASPPQVTYNGAYTGPP